VSRQSEADEIIKELNEVDYKDRDFEIKIKAYIEKYQTPVDPLWEKWGKMADWWHSPGNKFQSLGLYTETAFKKFKELFSDDLNGTRGLDEFNDWLERDYPDFNAGTIEEKYLEIKARHENPAPGLNINDAQYLNIKDRFEVLLRGFNVAGRPMHNQTIDNLLTHLMKIIGEEKDRGRS